MEFLFELVFQVLVEFVGEFLFQVGFRSAAAVLRSRVGRALLASGAGFGAGLWWGARLSEAGRVQVPRTLWTSLILALLTAAAAFWRWRRGSRVEPPSALSPPWRWPAYRFTGLALLNAAVAAGVAVGFQPHPLR